MLTNVLHGKENCQIVLIEDAIDQSGKPLLNCFLVDLCKRMEQVHIVCLENDPQAILQALPAQVLPRITVHDGFHDILGWMKTGNLTVHSDIVKYLQENPDGFHSNKIAMVIDSLSPLLLHRPPAYTCQTLHGIVNTHMHGIKVEQLICLVHRDLHDNSSLQLVEHTATCIMRIAPSVSNKRLTVCNTLCKRSSGKVVRASEEFSWSSTFELQDVTDLRSVGANFSQDESQVDPTANLTFNLSLSDKEKEARSQLKLPYMKQQNRKETTAIKSDVPTKIFYQPDEADDFDEEDPDDDLDI